MVNRINHPKTRILHAANGRNIATRNGIEGILSTSQAPATTVDRDSELSLESSIIELRAISP